MVEVLFLLLGATLAFVYLQHEQKKDLEKRVKTLELDYLRLCDDIKESSKDVYTDLHSKIHSIEAELWQHNRRHEDEKRNKELLKD
jgi:D-ribose pyranose/furanose isomerase RbsD